MNITVKTFADFREVLGKELLLSVAEGTTVRELLNQLGRANPVFADKIFGGNAQSTPSFIILKNGRNIHSVDGIETLLAEGDVIAIFPLVAGG